MKQTEEHKVIISKSILKLTFIMIIISTFLKLLGLDVFGLNVENKILINLCKFISNNKLEYIIGIVIPFIDTFIILRLSSSNTNVNIYYPATILYLIFYFFGQIIFSNIGYEYLGILVSTIMCIVMSSIIDLKINIKRPLFICLVIIIFQFLSLFLRNITYKEQFAIMYEILLNFDYIILMIVAYYLYLKKGSKSKWNFLKIFSPFKLGNGVFSFSDLKTLLLEWRTKWQIFSKGSKRDKIFVIVYLIISLMYEGFNLAFIMFIALLNNTIIECMFILTSFLITRKLFGTPFHFDSAIKCFIVSNLSYYILNRITISIGISFVIPVTLGILLSYITSRFVKERNENLYRGMPEADLLIICQNLNKYEQNLLTDYYCHRMSISKMGLKYHYSEDAIYKHKRKALEKLEEH